jgi:hypothetical protein
MTFAARGSRERPSYSSLSPPGIFAPGPRIFPVGAKLSRLSVIVPAKPVPTCLKRGAEIHRFQCLPGSRGHGSEGPWQFARIPPVG